jgi:outer membrane protein assembly factor BamB
LEEAWSVKGSWTGVASNGDKGTIYVIDPYGKCAEVDLTGKIQREFEVPEGSASILRLARLPGKAGKALLTFSRWGDELRAYDLNGKQLWKYPGRDGIDDVWAGDLNGDGADEVIVGYNGDTGLHVLDGSGKLLWKSTAIANVWHVCAGDVLGEGKAQVVTTSARGKVHVFGADGKKIKDLDAGFYASMVRIGTAPGKDGAAMVFVAGSVLGGGEAGELQRIQILAAALSGTGMKKWSLSLPTDVVSADVAQGRPWLAVGMSSGQVHVVDTDKGEIIAGLTDEGRNPEVGWATIKGTEAPVLLVASGERSSALRVTK